MSVDLQLATEEAAAVPEKAKIDHWVAETLTAIGRQQADLCVRVVDEEEMSDLNHRFRKKNGPTNVLSFPFESVKESEYVSLGDIIICISVLKAESNQQDKPVPYHFAHMVIHGTLHLCGFDHQNDEEAAVMEAVEKGILAEIACS